MLALAIEEIVGKGGSVVLVRASSPDTTLGLHERLGIRGEPTLSYGQRWNEAGYHVMASPGLHLQESITGVAATGVACVGVFSHRSLVAGHPLVPVLQIASRELPNADITISGKENDSSSLIACLAASVSGGYEPNAIHNGLVDFQMSRGWAGVSL